MLTHSPGMGGMEFAFDMGSDEYDEDDDDEDEAYFSFGGRGGEADIVNAMLMGQLMGGIYSLTYSLMLTHSLTHSLSLRWSTWCR